MRNKGTFNFAASFEALTKQPIDARMVVDNYADLINPITWQDSDSNTWLYNGAIVAVANDATPANNGVYYLKDASNYTSTTAWQKVGSGGISGVTWNDITGIPQWLSGTTLQKFQTGHTHNYNSLTNKPTLFNGAYSGLTGKPSIPSDINQLADATHLLFNKAYSGLTGKPDLTVYETKVSFNSYTGATKTTIDGIIADIQALSGASGSTMYTLSSPAAVTVGGITAGTVLTGLTTNQILEEILVPTLNPTLTAPYNSFVKTSPSADLYEIADVQTIAFSATFNRGTISPAYGTSGNRSGLPSIYNYTGTGLPSTHSSSALSDTQSATAYSIIQGNQSWSSTVTYLIGEQPKNSKGGNYSTPLAAGTTGSITRTIEGVYPLFATTVAIATQTKQTLVSMLSANNIVIPMVAQTAGYKQSFEIPNTWLSSRPLVGVQTYNTVSGQWEYQGATASNSLGYWNTTADNQTIQSNSIGYTKYSYNGTDRGAINIRLVF